MRKMLRKFWMGDPAALRAHLKRLDPEARRLRFGGLTSDSEIISDAQGFVTAVFDWRR